MIVTAAICPSPPLLIPELTGQAVVLPELASAAAAAVASLLATRPDVVVVAGPAAATQVWDPEDRLNLAAYAPAPGRPGKAAARPGRDPGLPLSLGVGVQLLDDAGYDVPRVLQAVAETAEPGTCRQLGEDLAALAPRVALLAMGDGSARRSVSAPGYLDERAAPFDAAVERAVRDGDLAALAALDPALARDLMATGRPAWQVLAAALTPAGLRPEVLYRDDPYGVAYLVAVFRP